MKQKKLKILWKENVLPIEDRIIPRKTNKQIANNPLSLKISNDFGCVQNLKMTRRSAVAQRRYEIMVPTLSEAKKVKAPLLNGSTPKNKKAPINILNIE